MDPDQQQSQPLEPEPLEPQPLEPEQPLPRPGRGRAAILFAAGALTGAVAMVLALALAGVIGPAGSQEAATATSQSPSPATTAPLVTPPPIVAPAAFTPTGLANGYALGSADARVTVEVWADYQCPYCARFSTQVEPQIISTYVTAGKVRLVFRDLAFLGDESGWAAVAARLAEQQGMFWPYHDYLFANQLGENVGSFGVERLQEIAGRVGLDRASFDAGLELASARDLFAQIQAESEADATPLGIHATPTVVVDGSPLDGSDWGTVQAAIDAALAG